MNMKFTGLENPKDSALTDREKKNAEYKNYENKMAHLTEKFSELLKDNPIVTYVQHEGFGPENKKEITTIEKVYTDQSGSGGDSVVSFDSERYISVGKGGYQDSLTNSSFNKITKESFYTISRMMDELIKDSGYSDAEKTKMSQMVIDNLKNHIIEENALAN